MPLPGSLIERLCERLSRHTGEAVDIELAEPLGGGSINTVHRLYSNVGRWVVKVNHAERHPGLFAAEMDGLERLRATDAVRVPVVVGHGEDHDDAFLLMEHIEGGLRTTASWEALGRAVAGLHRQSASMFGLERDNYIGSLRQCNTREADWPTFLVRHRLEPLVRLARDRHLLDAGTVRRFERLHGRLGGLFPAEPPALLHGDLWSGNVVHAADGTPVLIDPAVYYGHREMDLAMARLFGGFDEAFFAAYQAAHPLEPGSEERAGPAQLYPLLVHVLLFGAGYTAQVRAVLGRFT